jgi:prepilin-type N-terminal cleavage/methylation domain-containing protein
MKDKGFSLIEVLVAAAVFSLILAVVAGLLSSASRSTQTVERRLDGMSDVRTVFDRIAADLEQMVRDGHTTLIVGKGKSEPGDSLTFLSRVRTTGSAADSRLAGILYTIGPHNNEVLGRDTLMLTRRLTAYPWTSDQSTAEFLAETDKQVDTNTDTSSLDALGETIMRMAVVVHKSDGTIVGAASAALPKWDDFTVTGRLRNSAVALDLAEVEAITVAFASLDSQSQILAADQLEEIASALPRPTDEELASGILPASKWSALDLGSISGTPVVGQNIRFYQRTFPIPR